MSKLTIALATHGRKYEAKSLINNIAEKIKNHENYELLIIENPSKNNLDILDIPRQFNVKYIQKKFNQGYDRSIFQIACYCKYKQKRVWFLCDDDEIYFDNFLKILNLLLKSKKDVNFIPWDDIYGNEKYMVSEKDAYKRMSFLPTISCNLRNLKIRPLLDSIGTNYIQISILNQLLKINPSINILNISAGKQTQNKTSRFPIYQTFLIGYKKELLKNNFLNKGEIDELIYDRLLSYLHLQKKISNSFNEKYKYLPFCFSLKNINFYKKIIFLFKFIWLLYK